MSGNSGSTGRPGKSSGGDQQQARRAARRRKVPKRAVAPPEEFWGDPAKLQRDKPHVRIITDPSAVVRSLGRPPLSGHQNHAEGYFSAVYQRSVTLASVLAAAGDLIAPDELVGERNGD